MFDLHLEVQPETAQRLKTLLELHPDQERFAQNVIAYQIAELKKAALDLQLDLKELEKEHKRSTEEFYEQFNQGDTDDREEYMLWAGLYEMLKENERQLTALQ